MENMNQEDLQNTLRSLVAAFVEGVAGVPEARLFLRNQGIRLHIDEEKAALLIDVCQGWVEQENQAFEGFERENGA